MVVSLPCSAVRLKPCECGDETDEQLRKQVEEQIGTYVLFEGREVTFDYCVFQNEAISSSKRMMLQAITPRQISDAYLAVADNTGLELVGIEPSLLAIIKLAFEKQAEGSQPVSLVLTIDSTSSSLSVFNNGLPQLCQNLNIGIKDLLRNTSDFSGLSEQIKSILDFARSRTSSQQLKLKVAAACDSRKLSTVVDRVKQVFNDVTVEQIDQHQVTQQFDIQCTDEQEVPFFALSSALTAFGVCEYKGRLNLVSQQSLNMRKIQKEISLTVKAVIAIVLLAVITLVPLRMKINSVEAVSTEVETQAVKSDAIKDKISSSKEHLAQLEEKLSAYDKAGRTLTDIPWAQVLRIIAGALPSQVRIVSILRAGSGDFTIVGEALAESNVYNFAKKLQDTELINSAKVEEIKYDNKGGLMVVVYRITCKTRLQETEL
jgi:hypothetical protein